MKNYILEEKRIKKAKGGATEGAWLVEDLLLL